MAAIPPRKPLPEKSYLAAAVESISPWSTSRSSTPKLTDSPSTPLMPNSQQAVDHVKSNQYGLSTRRYPEDCPPLLTRWFYAVDMPKRKPRLLKEQPADSKPLPPPKKFVSFSPHDSKSIELDYQRLIEEQEDGTGGKTGASPIDPSLDSAGNKENTSINEAGNIQDDGGKARFRVPVNEDFLFDVDIDNRELAPVYWLGPIYEVRRGSWFYVEGSVLRPCEENLALQLEEGFLKVNPFRYPKPPGKLSKSSFVKSAEDPKSLALPSSSIEKEEDSDATPRSSLEGIRTANRQAVNDATTATKDMPPPVPHEPQTHRLFGSYMNSVVTYQDETVAWISSDGIMSRVSSTMYQRFAGGGYLGGVKVVRGYKDSMKSSEVKPIRPESPANILSGEGKSSGLQLDARQQRLLKRQSAPPGTTTPINIDGGHLNSIVKADPPDSVLQGQITSVVDTLVPEKGEDVLRKREGKQMESDYQQDDGKDQSREIEHLILVTHGIGQRLGMRTESVNFLHDVNVLRQTLKTVYDGSADLQALNSEIDRLPKNCKIQVLPVCWRHLLDFPRKSLQNQRKEHDIGDEMGDDEQYPSLEDITVEGVPFVRSLITDLALDILLYQSAYREHISGIVLKECNRIYNLFVLRNPSFHGKVSLIGHSLGSAILFDILCRQKEEDANASHSEPKIHQRMHHGSHPKRNESDLSFDFPVEDFFCLGSPIGLFQMLKGRTIAARHHPNALPAQSPMDPDFMDDPFLSTSSYDYAAGEKISSVTGLPFTISSPKCSQLFNIFHPSDPIAYRLEPLITPAMSSLKPQSLPYTKKGMFGAPVSQGFTGIGAKVGQSVSGFWSNLSGGIASSLLNRSLGLTGEDVAQMTSSQGPLIQGSVPSVGGGTNISAGGVIPNPPILSREDTDEKKRQLAENTAAADREGAGAGAPTLIDDEIETLFAGFQKRRKSEQEPGEETNVNWLEAEEQSKKLKREDLKVRGLNQNGRVDFSIQESVLDFNPMNTIASHLSYWADEDVSHFMMSQLLSRHRAAKTVDTAASKT